MRHTVLITGTSSGLGLSTAILFAKNGYSVWATMRNTTKKQKLLDAAADAGVEVNVAQLDVTDSGSIQRCVDEMMAAEGSIDVLINNAGAGFVRTIEQATEEEMQWVNDVNYFGVVRCIKAVLPHMRASRSGHIVNITSVGGLVGQPFNELYCAAKFAVEGLTESLATFVTQEFGVRFSLVEPGGIASDFAASVLEQIGNTGGMLEDDYLPVLQRYLGNAKARADGNDSAGVYQTSDEVAEVVLSVVQSDDPPIRVRTSQWSEKFSHLKTASDPDGKTLVQKVIDEYLC